MGKKGTREGRRGAKGGRRERRRKGREGRPAKNRISLPILVLRVRTDERAEVVFLDFVFVPVSIALTFFVQRRGRAGCIERKD